MQPQIQPVKRNIWRLALLAILVVTACSPAGAEAVPTSLVTGTLESKPATRTATRAPSKTPTASPTATLTTTPTITPTPSPLARFSPKLLQGVEPVSYLADNCTYLARRWDPDAAEPGTVVAPIMYHSVAKEGREPTESTAISAAYFQSTLQHAHELGFETITTEQFIDFLENNARIPPRSLLLIVDDRRAGVVRNHFMPVLQQYNWTVTMAYITGVVLPSEWIELDELNRTGRIDVQAHGFMHNGGTYFTEFTEQETIEQELYSPIPVIEERFGKRPLAFIWPGGNYTPPAIATAREAGYKIGLTVHSRGPVMFDWVPLGEPERAMGDPLMVLPRYWSTAAYVNIDETARLGDEARNYALEHRQEELDWYATYCSNSKTPPNLAGTLQP